MIRVYVTVLALGVAGVVVAGADAARTLRRETYSPTERGASIATHAVFASRDFPAASGWVDTQIGIADHHLDPCGRRVDDLVITGYALTRFMHEASATGPITSIVISNADVFASEAMLDAMSRVRSAATRSAASVRVCSAGHRARCASSRSARSSCRSSHRRNARSI
jgi:hypothetical protein